MFAIRVFLFLLCSGSVVNTGVYELKGYGSSVVAWTVPAGVTKITVDVSGTGGNATAFVGGYNLGAGGGAAYARSVFTVVPGQVCYLQINTTESWFNLSAKAMPVLVTDGALAVSGGNGTQLAKYEDYLKIPATGGLGGSKTKCIGQFVASGGNGGSGCPGGSAGGGGGSGGPAGDGGDGDPGNAYSPLPYIRAIGGFGGVGLGNGGSAPAWPWGDPTLNGTPGGYPGGGQGGLDRGMGRIRISY